MLAFAVRYVQVKCDIFHLLIIKVMGKIPGVKFLENGQTSKINVALVIWLL